MVRTGAALLALSLGLSGCSTLDRILPATSDMLFGKEKAGYIGTTRYSVPPDPLSVKDNTPALTPEKAEAFFTDAAKIAEQDKDYDSAMQNWLGALKANPNSRTAALGVSKNLRAMGHTDDAERVLLDARRLFPGDVEVLVELGKAQLGAQRYDDAISTLKKAQAIQPSSVDIISALGVAHDYLNDHVTARAYYDQALQINGRHAGTLNNAGLSAAMAGDLERAETLLRQALIAPDATVQVRQNLAMVLGLQGKEKEARRLAKRDLPGDIADEAVDYYVTVVDQQDVWSAARTQAQ